MPAQTTNVPDKQQLRILETARSVSRGNGFKFQVASFKLKNKELSDLKLAT
jgi:hypothetical protein